MRRLTAIVALAAAATSCGGGGAAARELRIVRSALDATEKAPRRFVYTEKTKEAEVVVRGSVEDDLRYAGIMSINGRDTLEQVVADDSFALRFIDPTAPSLAPPLASEPRGVADALTTGKWVVDYAGAPAIVAPRTREGLLAVGQSQVQDAAYIFQYLRRAISDGQGVREFNPDALEYNPIDDPFEKPAKAAGVKRFDIIPPPLPRRSSRGTAASLPTTANFRKVAFYIRDGKLLKVDEQIDFESLRDYRRAKLTGGPKFVLEQLAAVRQGRTREPLRLRLMSYRVMGLGEPVTVQVPVENVLAAALNGQFGAGRGPGELNVGGAQPAASPTPAA
jgi:hypothetical protein